MRCRRYGQNCGGYEPKHPTQKLKPTAPRVKPILLPAIKAIPDLRSEIEQRSFHFFLHITGPNLSSDYDSGFWVTTVLKFSHLIPSVRHAVLAVSSLHESLIYDSTTHNDELTQKQIFAFQQYNKAISLLREQIDSQNNREPLAPLLLCVLFVCLEFMQRKNAEALIHLRQGRQLLHTTLQSKHLQSAQSDLICQDIVPMYIRSGLTSYLFGIDTLPIPETLNPYLEIPGKFSSFQHARHVFYTILDDSLRWRFLWKTSQRRDPRVPTDFAYKVTHHNSQLLTPHNIRTFKFGKDALLSRLSRWNTAFSLLKASYASRSTATPSLLLVEILYHTIIIWTSTAMSEAEEVYDEHMERFSALIPLCTEYLEATMAGSEAPRRGTFEEHERSKKVAPTQKTTTRPDSENHGKVVFTFETGIVPVLFLTAAKCRHPHIRRAAVKLLLRHEERQENLWKAQTFARIACRMIHIETEAGKNLQTEQGQTVSSPLTIPRLSCQRKDWMDLPFRATRNFWHIRDKDIQPRLSSSTAPTNLLEAELRIPWKQSPDGAQDTRCSPSNLARSISSTNSIAPTHNLENLPFEDSCLFAEPATEPIAGPSTVDLDTRGLSPESSTDELSKTSNPSSCRSMQSIEEPDLLPASECSVSPYGIPEHLRISDAIVGQRGETGINVTFFRKPSPFCLEWEIWSEVVLHCS
jgi:hypothetical protein